MPTRDAEEWDEERGRFNSGEGGPSCRPPGRLLRQRTGRWRLPWTWADRRLKAGSSPKRWCEREVLAPPAGKTEEGKWSSMLFSQCELNPVKNKKQILKIFSLPDTLARPARFDSGGFSPWHTESAAKKKWLLSQLAHVWIVRGCLMEPMY